MPVSHNCPSPTPCAPLSSLLQAVTQQWNPQYIVKADDDVYFRLDRLPHAARQWAAMHAGGCGQVWRAGMVAAGCTALGMCADPLLLGPAAP